MYTEVEVGFQLLLFCSLASLLVLLCCIAKPKLTEINIVMNSEFQLKCKGI